VYRPIGLAVLALIAGACSAGAPSNSSAPSSSPAGGSYVVPTGAGELILKIDTDGGFVAPGYILTHTPEFALYGDGRIVVPGPQIEIYPSPLLPNLLAMQIAPAEIQTIVADADAAGLLGPNASYDIGGIADAGTTVFTTVANGKTHRISAYALGIDGGVSEPFASPDVVAARAKLSTFRDKVMALNTLLGRTFDQRAYEPTTMRIFATTAGLPRADEPATVETPIPWPLSVDPGSGLPVGGGSAKCLVITGQDLRTFVDAARNANTLTRWQAQSGDYSISVRPLYPDESGCPI
jgi:hypothetical protein